MRQPITFDFLYMRPDKPTLDSQALRRALHLPFTDHHLSVDVPAAAIEHNNLANELRRAGRYLEAEQQYRTALQHCAYSAEIHANLAAMLESLGRYGEAEGAYRHAIGLNCYFDEARFNLASILLSQGRYVEGWPLFEARDPPFHEHDTVPFPRWAGEELSGRSLLLLHEQGHGDAIQFVRYAPLLKVLGIAQLTIACKPELGALFRTVEGIDTVVTDPRELRVHDYWQLLMSLPLHFGTTVQTIPAQIPYIGVFSQRMDLWKARIPQTGIRVGLVWKGNPKHDNDAARSMPHFSELEPLFSLRGVSFVTLQKGEAERQAASYQRDGRVVCVGNDIRDFADTAAILAQLNLVVSVDTSVAHLAGALGVACWLMLPRTGVDWRWHHSGVQSPWYPKGMYLFRQGEGGWGELVESIRKALEDIVGAKY